MSMEGGGGGRGGEGEGGGANSNTLLKRLEEQNRYMYCININSSLF